MTPVVRARHLLKRDVEKARKTLGPLPAPWPRPALVMLSGLPGTGKSYFARRLAERVPMALLSTDEVRFALIRRPTYTWQESQRVYDACHALIDELLAKGTPVIFDATNLTERYRQIVYEIAGRNDAKLVLVQVTAPPEIIMERMVRRGAGEDELDRSEADWNIYLKMKEKAQSMRRPHLTVDTSQPLEPALDQVVQAIHKPD